MPCTSLTWLRTAINGGELGKGHLAALLHQQDRHSHREREGPREPTTLWMRKANLKGTLSQEFSLKKVNPLPPLPSGLRRERLSQKDILIRRPFRIAHSSCRLGARFEKPPEYHNIMHPIQRPPNTNPPRAQPPMASEFLYFEYTS